MIGLGYAGLPLALEFRNRCIRSVGEEGKRRRGVGMDVITRQKISKNYAAAHATLLKNRFMPYKRNNTVIFDINECIGKELADARL